MVEVDRLSPFLVLFWIFLVTAALQAFNAVLLMNPVVVELIGRIPFLDSRIAWNQGVAFGLGHGKDLRWVLVLVSGIICTIFFVFGVFVAGNGGGTVMVVSGGLSNLVDRVVYGSVLDFISFDFMDFPLFNLSDVLISLGLLWFVLSGAEAGKGRGRL